MAKAPTSTAPAIEPEGRYRVRLSRTIVMPNGVRMTPRDDVVLKGKAIAGIDESAIASIEPDAASAAE